MKSIFAASILALASASAQAYQVNLDPTDTFATSIHALEICAGGGSGCGEFWDVTFEYDDNHNVPAGAPNTGDIYATPSNDEAGALSAATVIQAALAADGPATVGSVGSTPENVFYVPWEYDSSNCAQPGSGTCVAFADGFFGWGSVPVSSSEIDSNSGVQFARFSEAVVMPVPPAVWLFGSALGMLGWVRHRSRQPRDRE
jgi:hypothetical protein